MGNITIEKQNAEEIYNTILNISINGIFDSIFQERPKQTIEQTLESIRHHPSLSFYVPLHCSETIFSPESSMDLEEETERFLEGRSSILLLLGDSGSGKSTFCTHLALRLIDKHQRDKTAPLPFLIRLGASADAAKRGHLIEDELERLGLSPDLIHSIKDTQEFVFILDGYDELGDKKDIYLENRLWEWKGKVIVTSRTQYLEKTEQCRALFSRADPISYIPDPRSYKTLYIVPFSDSQVKEYLEKFAPSQDSHWENWKEYEDKIGSIYNLKELSSNPMLLSIIARTLPKLVMKGEIETSLTRSRLYEEVFSLWFVRECKRLKESFEKESFFEFAERLAFEMFLSGKIQIEYNSRKSLFEEIQPGPFENFFKSTNPSLVRARSGCPLQRTADNTYRFMHKSFQEFCVARKLASEVEKDHWGNLNKKLLTKDPDIICFLSERYFLIEKLLAIVEESKENAGIEKASSNAATILNAIKVPFSVRNLQKVCIPGADLTGAVLDRTDLSEANMKNVTLRNAFLKDTNLTNADMEGVEFGERPYLEGHEDWVNSVCFSPDGSLIASGSRDNTIRIWEADTGKTIYILEGHGKPVISVCFSPDGSLVASGSSDNTIRIWEADTGKTISILEGHGGSVASVCFNPDGSLIASGSEDNTIRIWEADTGKTISILEGHKYTVNSVCFSPDGSLIASGSEDDTIRIWETDTGKTISILEGHGDQVTSVCFSPDGSLIASGSGDPHSVKVWDMKKMILIWTTNSSLYCKGMKIKGARCISDINQRLLLQRGAISY